MAEPAAPEPVRFYVDDDARLPRTVETQLKLLLDQRARSVAEGYPQDWGQYRESVGYIKGLLQAIETCKEATKEFGQ